MPREASADNAGSTPWRAKSTVSRSSTGAVRWLTPTVSSRISEVVAPRQEIPDRNKVEQDDHESDRRQPRRALAAPADHLPREQREGVHRPREQRHPNLGI